MDTQPTNIFTPEQQAYIAQGLRTLFCNDAMDAYFDDGMLEWDPHRHVSEQLVNLVDTYVCAGKQVGTTDNEKTAVDTIQFSLFTTLHKAIDILGNEGILKAAYVAGK